MRARVFLLLLLGVAISTAGYVGCARFLARADADNEIRVSGNIETTEVQIAFKIAGRVEKRLFDEGQRVQAGDVVATLDTADLQATVELRHADFLAAQAAYAALKAGSRVQEIDVARAAVDKAEHALADLLAGSRPQEIDEAKAAVAAAQAEVDRTDADYHRQITLYERKSISASEFDATTATREIAVQKLKQAKERLSLVIEGPRKEQIQEARATLAKLKSQYDLVKIGPRQEDIDQGRAKMEQAKAAWDLAKIQLGYAVVRSPITGIVLSKNIEPGEYVVPGTAVVTIGELQKVWVRAYIEEPDLARVKLGQTAWVTSDFARDKQKRYKGVVAFIADEAEFTPKNVQTQKERVKLVYRIKINIENNELELKPGMPVDAAIELK